MDSESKEVHIVDMSWFDCIGDIVNKTPKNNIKPQMEIQNYKRNQDQGQQNKGNQNQQNLNAHLEQSNNNQNSIKRARETYNFQEQSGPCSSSSNDPHFPGMLSRWKQSCAQTQENKMPREAKQCHYSKTYRQRKKEQYKLLQEQNTYLKKRISQLQFRLREKQLQISRSKFSIPAQAQISVEGLSAQFVKKTNLHLQNVVKRQEQMQKTTFNGKDKYYQSFVKVYDKYGFGGTDKKQYLNYHINQFFQGLMKNSQKYLMLLFQKSQYCGDIPVLLEYKPINDAFFYIMGQLTEDKINRLGYFIKRLSPLYKQYKKLCSGLMKDFQKIITCCDQIHNSIRQGYLTHSRDMAYRRIKLETWFQFHKYGRFMRNLQNQWFNLIKQQPEQDQSNVTKKSAATKKKAHKS